MTIGVPHTHLGTRQVSNILLLASHSSLPHNAASIATAHQPTTAGTSLEVLRFIGCCLHLRIRRNITSPLSFGIASISHTAPSLISSALLPSIHLPSSLYLLLPTFNLIRSTPDSLPFIFDSDPHLFQSLAYSAFNAAIQHHGSTADPTQGLQVQL